MRITSYVLVAGMLVVFVAVSASANEPLFAPVGATMGKAAAPLFPSTPLRNPFTEQDKVDPRPLSGGQLQQLQSAASQLLQHLQSASRPTVICGMTLLPADPKLDAKIRTVIPAGGVNFTMRTVAPQVCRGVTTSQATAPPTRK